MLDGRQRISGGHAAVLARRGLVER
jgi:hypothetical protein